VTSQELLKFGWKVVEHPSYSPDLSPCNVHEFGELEKCLKGHCVSSDDEVQEEVVDILHQVLQCFYKDAINRLVRQWDKCHNSGGDYL
jgi:hypothetical protein